MEDIRTPSYYTVIPAPVRYDPNLSYFEIVLFSELVAMSTAFGFAFVTNGYLSKLYQKDTTTITRALKSLSDNGHITIEIDKKEGNFRKIFVITPPIRKNANTPISKNAHRSRAQVKELLKEKSLNNIPVNNQDVNPPGVKFSKTKKQVKTVDIEVSWLDDYLASIE